MVRQHPVTKRSRRGSPLGGILLLACSCLLLATGASLRSEKLKAAYVFNFLKFTHWPATPRTKPVLTLCLANADSALEEAFSTLDGRQINEQRISVQRLSSLEETAGCQVLYLQQGGAPISLRQLSRRNPGLLTIGDDENFLQQGGIIQLVEEQNRLQFDINLTQLQQADFNISAQMLKLARNARNNAQ